MPTYMHTHAYKHTHAHTHAYMAFFYETAFFPDIGRTTDLYKSTPWNFIISDLKKLTAVIIYNISSQNLSFLSNTMKAKDVLLVTK